MCSEMPAGTAEMPRGVVWQLRGECLGKPQSRAGVPRLSTHSRSLVTRDPYRTVARDSHAFGAFPAHPSIILHATFPAFCLGFFKHCCHRTCKVCFRTQMALVRVPYRTVACDCHAFGAFAAHPYPHTLVIAVHWVWLELLTHFLNPGNESGTTPT